MEKDLAGKHTAALAILLACGIVVVYGRLMIYPFVQEDWGLINDFVNNSISSTLHAIWSPTIRVFHRPIAQTFLLGLYCIFGLHATGYHVVMIGVHFLTSLLVVFVIRRICSDWARAWAAGFTYALALTIHVVPLTWCVGIYDILGAFLFFLSIALFLRGSKLSIVTYALSLLTKEIFIIIPAVLLIVRRIERRSKFREDLNDLLPHIVLSALYVAFKLYASAPLLIGNSPYGGGVALIGSHVLQNVQDYAQWMVESIVPYGVTGLSIGLSYLSMSLVIALSPKEYRRSILPAILWTIVGLLPVVFLKADGRYYATYALAPFLLLVAYAIRTLSSNRLMFIIMMAVLISVEGISSSIFLSDLASGRCIAGGYPWGTENVVWKGGIVKTIHEGLLEDHPSLPRGAILVFDLNAVSLPLFKPQLWYQDSTIEVYWKYDIAKDSTGMYAYSSNRRLDPEKTFLFCIKDHKLTPEAW